MAFAPNPDVLLPGAAADPAVEAVRARLMRAVLAHRLPPGAKLTEDEIARVCGVGRGVVRAALRALAQDRVAVLERNRGAFVARPDPAEAREVFEARRLVEPTLARAASERADAAALARLEAHLAQERAATDAGDAGRAVALSGRFHLLVAEIAVRPTIAAFLAGLVARSSLVVALYWRRAEALCGHCDHGALVAALAARDAAAAGSRMLAHLVAIEAALDFTPRAAAAVDLARALEE
jgi:DNA-binding GntR family transcriptional regulator